MAVQRKTDTAIPSPWSFFKHKYQFLAPIRCPGKLRSTRNSSFPTLIFTGLSWGTIRNASFTSKHASVTSMLSALISASRSPHLCKYIRGSRLRIWVEDAGLYVSVRLSRNAYSLATKRERLNQRFRSTPFSSTKVLNLQSYTSLVVSLSVTFWASSPARAKTPIEQRCWSSTYQPNDPPSYLALGDDAWHLHHTTMLLACPWLQLRPLQPTHQSHCGRPSAGLFRSHPCMDNLIIWNLHRSDCPFMFSHNFNSLSLHMFNSRFLLFMLPLRFYSMCSCCWGCSWSCGNIQTSHRGWRSCCSCWRWCRLHILQVCWWSLRLIIFHHNPITKSHCCRLLFNLLFFRPTPDGSRQVVYQAGKTIAFCKLTELKLRQRRSWRQCAYKRELNWISTQSIGWHRAEAKRQQNKHKKPHKPKQEKPKQHQQAKEEHGRWSADQFVGIMEYKKDDIIVSPKGLVWHRYQKRNNKTKVPYGNLWARKQQMHNAETKAPPREEPRDHRVPAARATFSQIHGYDPKAGCDAVMWQLKKETSETWRETDLRWDEQENTGAQEPLRVLSRVLCLSSA